MKSPSTLAHFDAEQRSLWDRVVELWTLAKCHNEAAIVAALHPDYLGWDTNTPAPHDRSAAVASVTSAPSQLRQYALQPLGVQVYDHRVGVVHYAYVATVVQPGGGAVSITGRWTEVYLKQADAWIMLAVSGRPDASLAAP